MYGHAADFQYYVLEKTFFVFFCHLGHTSFSLAGKGSMNMTVWKEH